MHGPYADSPVFMGLGGGAFFLGLGGGFFLFFLFFFDFLEAAFVVADL